MTSNENSETIVLTKEMVSEWLTKMTELEAKVENQRQSRTKMENLKIDYETKIENLKTDHEQKMENMKLDYGSKIENQNTKIENSKDRLFESRGQVLFE